MKIGRENIEFYKELESSLPTSTEAQREVWATTIIENDTDLKSLFNLLKSDYKIACRFLWLLGRVGMTKPQKLYSELSPLLEFSDQINPKYKESFANFWLMAGFLPELKNELKVCLEDQMDKYSSEFKKKALKILSQLERKTSFSDRLAGIHKQYHKL